jgi:YidC/Oxa1 family membrane protein insertase
METGNYLITTNINDKKIPNSIDVENKWTIVKLFVYLFYAPAYNLIIILINLFNGSFGWAIIIVTVMLRLLLLWPQHKMMVSQKKLQELQPKIKEIQNKYKWNHQMLGVKTMELYKKEKVNPMWSCGFLLIQMPILLVIYNVILYIKDPSNHYYLYMFLKDFDFNSINYHFYSINLLEKAWITWVILGLVVAILQFIQIKLSTANNKLSNKSVVLEKKKWATDYSSMMPDPEMMNKVMLYWMPVMVWIFTYNFPAWLGIYWGISTSFMIIQQLVVNNKLKKSS